MESRLVKLNSDFNNVITIRNSVKNIFDILQTRIDKLKLFYSEFVKNNRTEMFVFGLDSFNFQSKIIDIEYDDMKRLFLAINNRMYCEYFKLNKIIIEYILKNVNEKKIVDMVKVNNYPVYKDLEPFKEYKFEIILDIHENILNLLTIILSILTQKENELSNHKIKQSIGLNIDNYITTFNYNNIIIREKIGMFISYIEFFHKMHTKYLKRFSNKIQLMYTHINTDINFDTSIEPVTKDKKEFVEEPDDTSKGSKSINALKKTLTNENLSKINQVNQDTMLHIPSDQNLNSLNSFTASSLTEDSDSISSTNSISSMFKRSASFGQLITSSPNKTIGIKSSIKQNVNKIKSNVLQLFKPKEEPINTPIMQNVEVDNIFTNIELSCDTIINTEENSFRENLDTINEVQNEVTEEMVEIQNNEIPEEIIDELKEEIINEPKEEIIDELKEEDNITVITNTDNEQTEIKEVYEEEIKEMDDIKPTKKRNYKSKKK